MELLQNYPLPFLVTVVLPLITGIVLSFGGYESLKARSASEKQLDQIEKNTEETLRQLPDINSTLSTLDRYEKTLAAVGERDATLEAVLSQYKKMSQAAEQFAQFKGTKNPTEKNELANEILELLTKNILPVSVREDLPARPLVIKLGGNTFKVLFAVPMRIPPNLTFQNIPEGANANIIEKTKLGFTVQFSPAEIEVTNFGFIADAEL